MNNSSRLQKVIMYTHTHTHTQTQTQRYTYIDNEIFSFINEIVEKVNNFDLAIHYLR